MVERVEVAEVRLSVPLHLRRGALRKDERSSVRQGIELLGRVDAVRPVEGARILDFGCGVKIGQALYQLDSPQALYVGVDVHPALIRFMRRALAHSPKYRFATVPFRNDMYNPSGEEMTAASALPVDGTDFDIVLMFSVITHMTPKDSAAAFAILRRYVAADGRLVFWAFANEGEAGDFRNLDPQRPLFHAVYRRAFLDGLIEAAGWRIEATSLGPERPGRPELRQTHYICAPA